MALVRRVAVTLLRHGLTLENKQKQYIGLHDPSLCEEGIHELQRLKGEFVFPKPEIIISSDRKRSIETSSILYPNLPHVSSGSFCELHFGEWEGKTYDKLKHNPQYRKWIDEPSQYQPPGGESLVAFEERLESGWQSELVSRFDDNQVTHIVLISHGGPIRYLLNRFAPDSHSQWLWRTEHGRGYTLYWDIDGIRRGDRCISLQEAPFTGRQNG